MNDPRIEGFKPSAEQRAMVELLRAELTRSTSSKAAVRRTVAKRSSAVCATRLIRVLPAGSCRLSALDENRAESSSIATTPIRRAERRHLSPAAASRRELPCRHWRDTA